MKIKDSENFCRVFELPLKWPTGFCFGGGHDCQVTMVDWFNPAPPDGSDWSDEWRKRLVKFVSEKKYVKPGRQYLILTEFDESFTFRGETK